MIRFLLRFIGFWLLAGGVVALVVDGTRSIAASQMQFMSALSAWSAVSPSTLEKAKASIEGLSAAAWADAAAPVLDLPLFALLCVVGFLLMALGRKRRRSRFDA
ncbi:hypothetical protein J5J86_04630 [Aquabacter sp. L1I39]|uniref:hypothetical protein n=1 Tax=Aquabacter sp. L1I39 TaxID=2820278 RepID=UPI001ADB7550|nr:hypothetical protein [Aquabacter sp. L1I39]QTL04625.1 hypothetical protein J5J86_04630 [Aquabacter sp. L1I39]